MAKEQNVAAGTYFSGDSLLITFTVYQEDETTPKPLTSATITWGLSKAQGKTPIVTKSATITDAANGVCTVQIDPADTAALSGTLWHELEVTDISGNVSTSVYGTFVIEKDSVNN